MRIAILNITKPVSGTGDNITEYAYQIYKNMTKNKRDTVESVYAIEETRRNNVSGILYTHTLFKNQIKKLAEDSYDIIHIANHELGFVAKILKESSYKGKIVTTIHDTMRLRNDLHRGVKQKLYNNLTAMSIGDAINYSDLCIFTESKTIGEIRKLYNLGKYAVIPLGINESLINDFPKKAKKKTFSVGYIGYLVYSKNIISILEAAKRLEKYPDFKFYVYGNGPEMENLMQYKIKNNLVSVELKGVIQENKIKEIYDSFDAFVFPALGENYSMAILEAMARGLPVVISKESSLISEVRRHCIEFRDSKELSEILTKLKKKGYGRKEEKEAMDYARGMSWEKSTKETRRLYQELWS